MSTSCHVVQYALNRHLCEQQQHVSTWAAKYIKPLHDSTAFQVRLLLVAGTLSLLHCHRLAGLDCATQGVCHMHGPKALPI